MVKQTIKIFARLKPAKKKLGGYNVETDEPLLTFHIPKDLDIGFVNNKKENYKFQFEKIFDQQTKQDEVFDNVALPVINNVLAGYNGTIFAYGQTGSGKTFTITGGPEKYADRGIIPRTLSYIFDYYQKNKELVFTTHVSYLEIYNESGFDLLNPEHEASKLEDLPKVSLMEDSEQNIHLKNLSTHPASNEEEALNLLFLGDTNRMIAETPMNQASTRSHCIFTIHISSRESGSATIRRSKLHLVDLAGSERVSKTGVNGTLLTEAKYINLSLHYLEQVIVALSEHSRQHIPYRNSMMTSVLRDSLGGNCMTTMIATCSVEKKNIDESISTCRFAQRVALIKNDAILNEELDPKLIIVKLKKEIQQLKEELALATGEQRSDELTNEEISECEEAVKAYVSDTDPESVLNVGGDMRKIHLCFSLLKNMANKAVENSSTDDVNPETNSKSHSSPGELVYTAEEKKLKELIVQRDNEINILVNMLKKEKKRFAEFSANQTIIQGNKPEQSSYKPTQNINGSSSSSKEINSDNKTKAGESRSSSRVGSSQLNKSQESFSQSSSQNGVSQKMLKDLSIGRQQAFEIFRRDYQNNKGIEKNKNDLKIKYGEAKSLGQKVNTHREKINKLKVSIEQHQISRAMQEQSEFKDQSFIDPMEEEIRERIDREKISYKESFNQLKNLKTEIEHLQHLLECSKVQLLKDFELWWAEQTSQLNNTTILKEHSSEKDLPPLNTRSAWRSPSIPSSHYFNPSTLSHKENKKQENNFYESNNVNQSRSSSFSSVSTISNSPIVNHATRTKNRENSAKSDISSPIPLTGDPQADADIMAFLRARQNVLQKAHGKK